VEKKAGLKYCRVKPYDGQYSRWGVNPGSVRICNQKLAAVPQIIDKATGKVDNIKMCDNIKDMETKRRNGNEHIEGHQHKRL